MSDRFTTLSRDEIRAKRAESLENGYVFTLHTTSIEAGEEVNAKVRRISLMDKAILDVLPVDIQKVVWDGLQEYQKEAKKAQAAGDPQSLAEMVKNNSQALKAADAWCIASFIKPQLVRTEDELSLYPGAWLLEDVAAEDRIAVMQACTDSDSDAARNLKKFRPESTTDARNNDTVPAGEPAAERVLADTGDV